MNTNYAPIIIHPNNNEISPQNIRNAGLSLAIITICSSVIFYMLFL
jgi:hypothetical protein